ncbi:MAG: ribosomal protein S18 acetylase RimI-like enzyme [Halioglobus sp.]|jgi:ribosomal protein S18 acetylase RimI-like enzyme
MLCWGISLKVRAYQTEDLDELLALWRECGLVAPQNNPIKDIERKLKVDPDLFLVGVLEERLVASVMGGYEGHRGWVNYLAVNPSVQGRGYGREIMSTIEQQISNKGCPKINLQVRSSNASVIAFYQSLGYIDDNVVGMGKRLQSDLEQSA